MKRILIAGLMVLSSVAMAKDIYKWTEGGQTYYSDRPQSASAVTVSQPIMVVQRGARVSAETLAADRLARAEKRLAAERLALQGERLELMRETATNQAETAYVVAGWGGYHAHGARDGRRPHKPTFRGSRGGHHRPHFGGRP